jgi:tRNA pseudouridine55 synthase
VDKPERITSHDVVNRVRRMAGTRRVGHLGTLDPMATGVLPLLIGRATRLAQFFSTGEKKYDARFRFGWSTDTYDREGKPSSDPVAPEFTKVELENALAPFRGTFLQTPPSFSAKKIAGTPAYRLARKQIAVELRPVEVHVFALDLLEFEGATARVYVHCSAGTYLRSIAHDLGRKLGCGAHLDALRRTGAGEFTEDQARTLDQLAVLAEAGTFDQAIVPASELLPQFPNALVDAVTVAQIRQGKDFRLSPFVDRGGARRVKAISREGDLVAIGEARLPHLYHPILVL